MEQFIKRWQQVAHSYRLVAADESTENLIWRIEQSSKAALIDMMIDELISMQLDSVIQKNRSFYGKVSD